VTVLPLSAFGLVTTAEVAAYHGCSAVTVANWIGKGYLRAVPVGGRCHLVARADCEGFAKPRIGRPRGGASLPRRARTVPLSRFGLMTVKQFAKRHRRAEQTVLRWISVGRFPAARTSSAALTARRSARRSRARPRGRTGRRGRGKGAGMKQETPPGEGGAWDCVDRPVRSARRLRIGSRHGDISLNYPGPRDEMPANCGPLPVE
jgi:hypothetical protein